jgi:hypothetical protein
MSSSFPMTVLGVVSLAKRPLLLTSPWAPNLISDSAVNLKPPILPPPEPPPTGLFLNSSSTDELVAAGCISCRPPPKPPWLYWVCFKLAWKVFVDMSQQRFVSLDKDLAGSLGIVDNNICKHFLFQFSSNQVLRFDIIETTYSRNEPAAVANLIRNWIEKKTVDFLFFIVTDRGRKTLQPWMFVCRCWLNSIHLALSQCFITDTYPYLLLGFNLGCFLSTYWRCFKDFSLNQLVILVEFDFN